MKFILKFLLHYHCLKIPFLANIIQFINKLILFKKNYSFFIYY